MSFSAEEKPILAIVVPCYNEEKVLDETSAKLHLLIKHLLSSLKISEKSFIYFVDDGSKDKTWFMIKSLHESNAIFKGLKLSRNFGHQFALLSGLMNTKNYADCIVSLDADLQDDPNVIEEFIDEFRNGIEVVYGVRYSRKSDSVFKKHTAQIFYKFMQLMGVDIIYNHADYRLTSRRVLEELSNFKESNLFLRGIFPQIGFKSSIVYYERKERFAGSSKYSLRRMISLALNAIVSSTIFPLRLISMIGVSIFVLSFFLGGYTLLGAFLGGNTVPGWLSTVLPIYFIGGIQLLSLGVIGEYVGKIYKESKARPRYINDIEIF